MASTFWCICWCEALSLDTIFITIPGHKSSNFFKWILSKKITVFSTKNVQIFPMVAYSVFFFGAKSSILTLFLQKINARCLYRFSSFFSKWRFFLPPKLMSNEYFRMPKLRVKEHRGNPGFFSGKNPNSGLSMFDKKTIVIKMMASFFWIKNMANYGCIDACHVVIENIEKIAKIAIENTTLLREGLLKDRIWRSFALPVEAAKKASKFTKCGFWYVNMCMFGYGKSG